MVDQHFIRRLKTLLFVTLRFCSDVCLSVCLLVGFYETDTSSYFLATCRRRPSTGAITSSRVGHAIRSLRSVTQEINNLVSLNIYQKYKPEEKEKAVATMASRSYIVNIAKDVIM